MNIFHASKEELIPKRATAASAGYDFVSPKDFIVRAHDISDLIDCEVSIELDLDKVLLLFTRSGNGIMKGITLCNNVGVVDADYYPRTIGCRLKNDSDTDLIVHAGDKIMQGVIVQYFKTDEEEINCVVRTGGFGSTGN